MFHAEEEPRSTQFDSLDLTIKETFRSHQRSTRRQREERRKIKGENIEHNPDTSLLRDFAKLNPNPIPSSIVIPPMEANNFNSTWHSLLFQQD